MAKISPVKKSCFDTHSDISDARFNVIYEAAHQVAAEGKRGVASNEDYIAALQGLIGASKAQIAKLSTPTEAPKVIGPTVAAPEPTTIGAAKAQVDNNARAAELLKAAQQQWETTYEIDEDGTRWADLTLPEQLEYAQAVDRDDGTSGDVADQVQLAHLATPSFQGGTEDRALAGKAKDVRRRDWYQDLTPVEQTALEPLMNTQAVRTLWRIGSIRRNRTLPNNTGRYNQDTHEIEFNTETTAAGNTLRYLVAHELGHFHDQIHGGIGSRREFDAVTDSGGSVIGVSGELAIELASVWRSKISDQLRSDLRYPIGGGIFVYGPDEPHLRPPREQYDLVANAEMFAQVFALRFSEELDTTTGTLSNPLWDELSTLAPKTAAYMESLYGQIAEARSSRQTARTEQGSRSDATGARQKAEGYRGDQIAGGRSSAAPNRLNGGTNPRTIQSGNKVIDAMPGAVANAWESLKHHGGLLATKMMLTGDLLSLASKHLPSALKYQAAMDKVEVEKTKAEQAVADILVQFNALSTHEKGTGPSSVNALIKASTMGQKWAFEPDWLQKNERTDVDPELQKRFNALSKPAQATIKAVFKHGHDSLKAMQRAVLDNTNSEYDAIIKVLKAQGKTAEVAEQEKLKAKQLTDFQTLLNMRAAWPYAPLRRFGKHVVVGMSARYVEAFKNKDAKKMQELESNGDDYYVAFAESRTQAKAMKAKIAPRFEGGAVDNFERLEQADNLMGGRDMIGALRRLRKLASEQAEDKGLGEATSARVDDLMRQLYLTLLSETSARKGEINRRNISGADDDMMRAFATNGRATAHFIAALKTGGTVDDHLAGMRSEVRNTLNGREKPQQYFNEIMRRHSMNLEFNDTPGVDKALAVSSTYLLLSNPSYFLMNATQPWMMSHPMMAGKHGYHNAAKVLLKSYEGMASILKDGKFDGKDYDYLPADVREAVKELSERGIITIELGQELGKFASSPDNKAADALAWTLTKLRNTAQGVETLNRLTTAITAYRLEMQRPGASKEKAIDYAAQVINETHGNYTGFNAPRFMRTPIGRLTTQFRKFQLIQLSMFARLLNRAFAGASKEEKAIARKALAFNLAHLAAVGGTAAMPGFVMVSWLLGKAFGDEDEPDDLRAKMTRELGKPMADLLWGGLSQKAGVPLGGRIGAGGMLSLLPYTDIEVSRDGYADVALGLAGPTIGGLMPRAADGIGMMLKGDMWKGTEALLPAGVANLMKAGRFATQGVTQRNGDTVLSSEEIGYLDVALQAVGLPTNTLQDRTWLAGAKFEATKFYNDRTSQLKKDYTEAVADNDVDAMREAREAWAATQVVRRELGFKVQPLSELLKAPAERRKRELSTVGGVATTKNDARFIAALQ